MTKQAEESISGNAEVASLSQQFQDKHVNRRSADDDAILSLTKFAITRVLG
jgi:hypothetical protein